MGNPEPIRDESLNGHNSPCIGYNHTYGRVEFNSNSAYISIDADQIPKMLNYLKRIQAIELNNKR